MRWSRDDVCRPALLGLFRLSPQRTPATATVPGSATGLSLRRAESTAVSPKSTRTTYRPGLTFQPGLILGHTFLLLLRSLLDQLVYLVGGFFGGFQLRISLIAGPEDRRLAQYFIILGKSGVLHDLSQRG